MAVVPMKRYMRDPFEYLGLKSQQVGALRQYTREDAETVRAFVAATPLHPLSAREALKWLEKREKKD